ncbi:hypothetical protein vseg_001462 [Gypsophila vaccaria]
MENSDEMKKTQPNLKQLGCVRVAAINTLVWLSNVYDYAKTNSGPLRSAISTVETLLTPLLIKFKDVPHHLLVFLDHKVDVASTEFQEHAPELLKRAATGVHDVVQATARVTKLVIHEAQTGGPLNAAYYAANEAKDLLIHHTVRVWSMLDGFAPFHVVAEMTLPTAAHFSDKYNNLVSDFRGKGYPVFSYVPLLPIEDIAKAFKHLSKGETQGEGEGEGAVVSQ